jgi:hypothetical protein
MLFRLKEIELMTGKKIIIVDNHEENINHNIYNINQDLVIKEIEYVNTKILPMPAIKKEMPWSDRQKHYFAKNKRNKR